VALSLRHAARQWFHRTDGRGVALPSAAHSPTFCVRNEALTSLVGRIWIGDPLTPGMFLEGVGLQECALAHIKAVPGRGGKSGREQVRAEHVPICVPLPASRRNAAGGQRQPADPDRPDCRYTRTRPRRTRRPPRPNGAARPVSPERQGARFGGVRTGVHLRSGPSGASVTRHNSRS
jgi:hypothetical protein